MSDSSSDTEQTPTKTCLDCQTMKPLEDFPRNRSGRDGGGAYCKPCHNARGQATRERRYGGGREYHVRARYGIGQVEYDCNQALGNARDDIDVLRRLVNYLHASRGVSHQVPVEFYKTVSFDIEWVPAFLHDRRP